MSEDRFEFREIFCPVCNAKDTKFLGWRGGNAHHNGSGVKTAVVRCVFCTHQYPNPMPFPKDGRLDKMYVDAESYFRGHDVEGKKQDGLAMMGEFERRVGSKGRFLDVGCGIGENLWAAKKAGWEYEGVDPSAEFIEIGIEKLHVTGRVCLLEEAQYPDNHFDAVAMSAVIEHVYEPFPIMSEIKRVLKPGGVLWFDAPNEDGLYMTIGNLYMKLRRRDWVVSMAPTFPPFHVQGFNPISLRNLIRRAGLEIEDLDIHGDVWEFTGKPTFAKKVEHQMAKMVSWFGNRINKGAYMSVWARNPK